MIGKNSYKKIETKKYWSQDRIISWGKLFILWIVSFSTLSSFAQLRKNLRFELSDDIRVYSDKAYRKNKGQTFEAVGNVIIISGAHTIYGETATLDTTTKDIRIEGNVRYNTQGLTIFGSKLNFVGGKNEFTVEDARIITDDFNVIAKKIKKISDDQYLTEEAEFTTCRDCAESWTIYGKEIHLTINQYVRIKHAEVRVKGINILYIPYLVLPVKSDRESGLLFPTFYQRQDEGIAFEQPVFWAIDRDKDLTLTPTLLGERGYGTGIEYRQVFSQYSWIDFKTKILNDKMYIPQVNNDTKSGEDFTRFFTEFEGHIMPTQNMNTHFRFQVLKDLDFLADFYNYVEDKFDGSSARVQGSSEYRFESMTVGAEFDISRNFLFKRPHKFDEEYVQVLPEVSLLTSMMTFYQSDSNLFKNVSGSIDTYYTIFKQKNENDSVFLRNARRVDLKPVLNWQIFSAGPFDLRTNYTFDFQNYKFSADDESSFSKRADILKTELSFSIEKIFGSSYRNTYSSDEIIPTVVKTNEMKNKNDFIGEVPDFQKSFATNEVIEKKNSYRHGQEYKIIHHLITGEEESGNNRFKQQIQNNNGWFDYRDAVRSTQSGLGSNETRTLVPIENTIELQWNNSLVKKSPNGNYSLADGRYLKDNFIYKKIGHLNLSQGLILKEDESEEKEELRNRLTRLYLDVGIVADRWNFDLDEYYFHENSKHLFNFDVARRFDFFSAMLGYNLNSLDDDEVLRTAKAGLSILPLDLLGVTYIHSYDLENESDISKRVEFDFMPNNNCWIFNFGYEEGTYDRLVTFNFIFNFADQKYKNYRSNYLGLKRLQ